MHIVKSPYFLRSQALLGNERNTNCARKTDRWAVVENAVLFIEAVLGGNNDRAVRFTN